MRYLFVLILLSIFPFSSYAGTQTPCQPTDRSKDCDFKRINTRGWEDSPYISLDGNRLYFMYNPHNFFEYFFGGEIKKLGPNRPFFSTAKPDNAWSDANTYVSTRQGNGKWSVPVRVPWDRKGGSCCAMGSEDEKTFWFQTGKPGSRDDQDRDIAYVTRKGNGWSDPVLLGPSVNSTATEDNPHKFYNLPLIIFTSTRSGGFGGKDLWFSFEKDGQWVNAVNMGPNINSSEDDDQAWVGPDNSVLYFTRGTTIMTSAWVNGVWQPAQPVKFETPVTGAEPSLTKDGKLMYLAVVDTTRRDIVISVSRRLDDGRWSTPVPVD